MELAAVRLRINLQYAGKMAGKGVLPMLGYLLWLLLFVVCWPIALIAIVLYPIVWLLLLPFRILGIAVEGALSLVTAIIFLPVRLLRAV